MPSKFGYKIDSPHYSSVYTFADVAKSLSGIGTRLIVSVALWDSACLQRIIGAFRRLPRQLSSPIIVWRLSSNNRDGEGT